VIPAITIGSALAPEDPEAPTPLLVNLVYGAFAIIWVVSAIHVFRTRKEWLRWKAAQAVQAPWYESSQAVPPTSQSADLTDIGIDDPTSNYLAPTPPTSAVTPTATPSRRTKEPAPPPSNARPPSRPLSPASVPELIDLNTATVDDIASLPGVGIATAHRIVEERNRRGGFASVDEAAVATKLQPHVRSRLQQGAVVSERPQPRRRGTSGRIVDI